MKLLKEKRMIHKIRLKFCLDKHPCEHYSHFDMCRLEKLWKTKVRTAALPCLQSIASGKSKRWDFDIFLKHDVPIFYNRKRCLNAHFFLRSWPFLTKFQMIILKVFRIKMGKNSLIWRRILATTILDKIKWNSKPPSPPPKSRMKSRKGKNAPFSNPWFGVGGGGEGGLGFPFILSKIILWSQLS